MDKQMPVFAILRPDGRWGFFKWEASAVGWAETYPDDIVFETDTTTLLEEYLDSSQTV